MAKKLSDKKRQVLQILDKEGPQTLSELVQATGRKRIPLLNILNSLKPNLVRAIAGELRKTHYSITAAGRTALQQR